MSCQLSFHPSLYFIQHHPDVSKERFAADMIFFTLIVPTTMLNVIVLALIWRKVSLQTPTNMYLCNLAVSDLCTAVICEPVMIAFDFLEWRNNCEAMVLCSVLVTVFCVVSFLTIVACTFDRYLALRFHLRYNELVTVHRVLTACGLIWVASLTCSAMLYLHDVGIILLVCGAVFFTVVMMWCYLHIVKILRYHHRQIRSQVTAIQGQTSVDLSVDISHFKKTVWNLVSIIGWFAITYVLFLSITAIIFIKGNSTSVLVVKMWYLSIAIVCLNSLVNPLIYCCRMEDMRNGMKEMFEFVVNRIQCAE